MADDVLALFQAELPIRLIATSRSEFATCDISEMLGPFVESRNDDFDFYPVTDAGRIVGILEASSLTPTERVGGFRIADKMKRLSEDNLIGHDASILDFIRQMEERPCCLVIRGSEITGIVTTSDVQRLPVRAVLFAMVTRLEMAMTQVIRDKRLSDEDLLSRLSPERKKKLLDEIKQTRRDDRFVDLLLFMQFSDKQTIIKKLSLLPPKVPKTKFDRQLNRIRELRDALAHANEFASTRQSAEVLCRTVLIIDQWLEYFSPRQGQD